MKTLPKTERMSADAVLPCAVCGKQASHNGFFYRIRVEQAMVDPNAARRQHGLEIMIGSPAIAAVMGDRDVIRRWAYGTGEAQVCNPCLIEATLTAIMGAMEEDPDAV